MPIVHLSNPYCDPFGAVAGGASWIQGTLDTLGPSVWIFRFSVLAGADRQPTTFDVRMSGHVDTGPPVDEGTGVDTVPEEDIPNEVEGEYGG